MAIAESLDILGRYDNRIDRSPGAFQIPVDATHGLKRVLVIPDDKQINVVGSV